jgi:hypothetical protein
VVYSANPRFTTFGNGTVIEHPGAGYHVMHSHEASPLQVDFIADPNEGNAPLTVNFINNSTGVRIKDWQWDFGDGSSSAEQNPAHVYRCPDNYTVTLTAVDETGNEDWAAQVVSVGFEGVVIDSDEPVVEVLLDPGQLVWLKAKADNNEKTWVFAELFSHFPGVVFARPANEICWVHDRFLFAFSVDDILLPGFSHLFYSLSLLSEDSRIDFCVNDFNGLDGLVITTKKGADAGNLQTIQTIMIEGP